MLIREDGDQLIDEHAKNYAANPFVYYGFNKRKNFGRDALEKLAVKKNSEYKVALLYNNLTGERLAVFPGQNQNQQAI